MPADEDHLTAMCIKDRDSFLRGFEFPRMTWLFFVGKFAGNFRKVCPNVFGDSGKTCFCLRWNWKDVETHHECTPPKANIAPEEGVLEKTT